MKIETPDSEFIDFEQIKADLEKFIDQDEPWQSPPCPGCEQHYPQQCSPECSEVAASLSIEPIRWPIEKNVIALVFELTATRLFKTCWSCEGHMYDKENKLWKLPQACFYAQSAIYPKLISSWLAKLFIRKKLSYRWSVALSEISQAVCATYCIRPDLNDEPDPRLGLLQKDLKEIGKDLHSRLKDEARILIKTIGREQ